MSTGDVVWKSAKWVWEKRLVFWTWILPDQASDAMRLTERIALSRSVKYWRATWGYAGLVSLALTFTSAPQGRSVTFYALVGAIFVGCTLILFVRHSPARWVAPWRTSICGAICMVLPYALPGIADRYQLGRKFLRGGNPWDGDGFRYNGIVSAILMLVNLIICILFWWRSRAITKGDR
jgi:hypothetical protein